MTQYEIFNYFTATAAVIGTALFQIGMFIWGGDVTLLSLFIGQIALAGCLVHLRVNYSKDLKKSLDNSDSTKL